MCSGARTTSAAGSSTPTNSSSAASQATCPTSQKTERNALIGIAAGFGCATLALAGIAIAIWRAKRKEEKEKLRKEDEKQVLQRAKQTLQNDYDWLYHELPGPVRREMEAKKRARVRTIETTTT